METKSNPFQITLEPKDLYARASIKAVCPICAGRGMLLSEDEKGRTFAKPCTCRDQHWRKDLFNLAQIPSHFFDATLENFELAKLPKMKAAQEKVRLKLYQYEHGEMAKGLLLFGSTGTGKTRLLCALLREFIFRFGVRCQFIEFVQLLNAIKRGYDTGEHESEFLLPLIEVEILAIDELGKGRKTEWESSILDQIISKRYFARKLTFFTTNFPVDTPKRPAKSAGDNSNDFPPLKERIDQRIFSRIQEMCEFVDMDMPDYRVHPTRMIPF